MSRLSKSKFRENITSNRKQSYRVTLRQSQYSMAFMYDQRKIQPSSETKCYACVRKVHVRKNCSYHYNAYQQQNIEQYSKDDERAQDGPVHGAPK